MPCPFLLPCDDDEVGEPPLEEARLKPANGPCCCAFDLYAMKESGRECEGDSGWGEGSEGGVAGWMLWPGGGEVSRGRCCWRGVGELLTREGAFAEEFDGRGAGLGCAEEGRKAHCARSRQDVEMLECVKEKWTRLCDTGLRRLISREPCCGALPSTGDVQGSKGARSLGSCKLVFRAG